MSLTSVDLPEPLTPVTAVSMPSGIATSMFFRLFARAPRIDDLALARAGRRAVGVAIARSPRRYAPVSEPWPFASSSPGVPWKITWPPCSPAPGPEVDDVVGGADRLLVVLDDDDGVAEIAQPRQRRQQLAVVALVQADRRLVEHVEHAGQVRRRSASPAGCAALRRPTASRRCGRASGSRRRRRCRNRRRSRISRRMRPAMSASRSVSSSASNDAQRLGDRQVDVLGDRPALDASPRALRPAAARRGTSGTRAARGTARAPPASAHVLPRSGGAGSGITPSKSAPNGSRFARLLRRLLAFGRGLGAAPSRLRRRAEQQQVALLLRQLAERHRRDRCRSARRAPSSALAHQLAVALAPTARSRRPASDCDSSGTTRAGSKSQVAPRPWHAGHAPCGELNENARGVISGMLMPQSTHASRRENSRSPPSKRVDDDDVVGEARARSRPTRPAAARCRTSTISRSTTTSMVWLRRRSSLMSSSSDRNWPSMRALVKPRCAQRRSSFLNSPLRPRTIGASTLMRASCG